MSEIKRIKTRYDNGKPAVNRQDKTAGLTRKAFLDTLLDEAMEDPYTYASFDEAIIDLSGKFKLSMEELSYLKKQAKGGKVKFESFRKGK